ncbi:MAG TPA: hypothetical protein VFR86_14545 [Burkholderiaceae bacterium]|nr:hypothetical protein [Burkholderiaceae bacterium]
MLEPHIHVAFAPRGAGLLCAAFWVVEDPHCYGWFTGAKAYEQPASFFVLEDYYSSRETVCYRSVNDDVHGDWLMVSTRGEVPIERPGPVPEALCHALEQMQDAFVREWLFYRDDAAHAQEVEALRARELPVMGVNLRPKKLNKLQTGAPVWTYISPGADLNVIGFVARRWPLDYTLD